MESFSRSKIIDALELFYIGIEKITTEQPQNSSKLLFASKSLFAYLKLPLSEQPGYFKSILPLLQSIKDEGLNKYLSIVIDEINNNGGKLKLPFNDEFEKKKFFNFIDAQLENISPTESKPKSDPNKESKLDLSALYTVTLDLLVLLYQREIYSKEITEANELFLKTKEINKEINQKVEALSALDKSNPDAAEIQTALALAEEELKTLRRVFIEKFHKALSIIDKIPLTQRNQNDYINKLHCLDKIAFSLIKEDPRKAFEYYETSWKIRTNTSKDLLPSNNEEQKLILWNNMFVCLYNISHALISSNDTDGKSAAINQLIDFYEEFPDYLRDDLYPILTSAYELKANMENDAEIALKNYDIALSLMEKIEEDTQEWEQSLTFSKIECLIQLAKNANESQDFMKEYNYLNMARKLLEPVPENDKSIEYMEYVIPSLGQSYINNMDALIQNNKFVSASNILPKLMEFQDNYFYNTGTYDKALINSMEKLITVYRNLSQGSPNFKQKTQQILQLFKNMRTCIINAGLLKPIEKKHSDVFDLLSHHHQSSLFTPPSSPSSPNSKVSKKEIKRSPPRK